MAIVQLAGVLILRLLCNLPVWMRLRELSLERRASLNLLAGEFVSHAIA